VWAASREHNALELQELQLEQVPGLLAAVLGWQLPEKHSLSRIADHGACHHSIGTFGSNVGSHPAFLAHTTHNALAHQEREQVPGLQEELQGWAQIGMRPCC